ncbi:hypothetical protein [Nostoc sp.]|uniref:hypothetical protein n=1 Tax=Nostoc sp. TaxID=1180 RepID=UPI002FF92F8E
MSTKLIRRALIASGLFISAAVAFSPTAFAAPTDTVNLSGEIATQATIEATDTAGATALNLGGEGTIVTDAVVKVADLTMSTNNASGLKISLVGGTLIGTLTGIGTPITYQVAVATNGQTPATGDYSANISGLSVSNSPAEVEKDLYIRYSAPAINDPDTYEGSILLTVADN